VCVWCVSFVMCTCGVELFILGFGGFEIHKHFYVFFVYISKHPHI